MSPPSLSTPPITRFFGRLNGTSVGPPKDLYDISSLKRKAVSLSPFCSSPSSSVKQRRITICDSSQYGLDAGQKKIGGQYCEECGMSYNVDSDLDLKDHVKFHNRSLCRDDFIVRSNILESWIREGSEPSSNSSFHPVGSARIVLEVSKKVTKKTKHVSSLRDRVEKLIEHIVNPCIGFASDAESVWNSTVVNTVTHATSTHRKAYLAVLRDDEGPAYMAGCLVAELIREVIDAQAHEMIHDGPFLGVNRIWVHPIARGKGVAMQMVEEARKRFLRDGVHISADRVAFSEPTEAGERFARSYSQRSGGRLLLYNIVRRVTKGEDKENSKVPDPILPMESNEQEERMGRNTKK